MNVRREMDKLYTLYLDDNITKEGFGERYHPLDEQRRQIEDQIPEVQAELDLMKIYYLSSDQIISEPNPKRVEWFHGFVILSVNGHAMSPCPGGGSFSVSGRKLKGIHEES